MHAVIPLLLVLHDSHEETGNFLHDYWQLLTDPVHLSVEITITLLFDVLLLGLLWPTIVRFVKRRLEASHRELDEEHGITHHPDTGAIQRSTELSKDEGES